jgi:NADPH:quinone reductase-like Zn-dependent oxidoreductase
MTMRAIEYTQYGGPEVLVMSTRPSPKCGPGEVLIEMHAASVNPVDGKIRSGRLKPMPGTFPATTGRDGAGIVRQVGEGVAADLIGRRVCFMAPRGMGTWAEELALPAGLAVPIPDAMTFVEAASLPLAGTSAWIGLVETVALEPGMRVLIHAAAGGVGSLAVQLAKSMGAEVTATCSSRNAEYVRSLGASRVVAYNEARFEDCVKNLDVVFDLLGGEVHRRSYAVLRRGGKLVYLNAEPIEDRGEEFGIQVRMAHVLPSRNALAGIVDRSAAGVLHATVEKVLPFEEFAQAQRLSDEGHIRGKVVLRVR